jgi:hypothetical protein
MPSEWKKLLERDQENVNAGFPAESCDQQTIESGHRTVVFPLEMIPL